MPKLAKIDRETAKAIEEAMFVFENLLEMDDKNLGTFIRNVDGDVLTKALKGVDEGVRNRFLGCMSQRAADGIRAEMAARGRSEERRVGKECGGTCSYRWSPYHTKKNKITYIRRPIT